MEQEHLDRTAEEEDGLVDAIRVSLTYPLGTHAPDHQMITMLGIHMNNLFQ